MHRRSLFLKTMCLLLVTGYASSQSDHRSFAITSLNKGSTEWIGIRSFDTETGAFGTVLTNLKDYAADFSLNANTSATSAIPVLNIISSQTFTAGSAAALAYDQKNNRLFYTFMGSDQLRYIDLSSNHSYTVADQSFSKAGKFDLRNTGPINRMVIAPDDFGYTITNDGNHLLRFSTSGSPLLSDLGDLMDDQDNKDRTIHSFCANSGGDMIADDAGNLILITGNNNIYKIQIATRLTRFLGRVSGLAEKFTTSGLAVTDDGKRILATSVAFTESYYIIDPQTWTATAAGSKQEVMETADLANSNVLITKSAALFGKSSRIQQNVNVFPNPVSDDIVHVQLNELPAGKYSIQLTDALGTKVSEQTALVSEKSQSVILHIPRTAVQGFYYIRVLGERKNVVSVQKLVVERW